MTFGSWKEAAEALAAAVRTVTPGQLALGKQAGLAIPPETPSIVAAALLRMALAKELHLSSRPVGDHYKSRLKELRRESLLSIAPESEEEAEAWVEFLRLVRRRRCLTQLETVAGDIVRMHEGYKAEVSSIGGDGRVYFRGGRGSAPGRT